MHSVGVCYSWWSWVRIVSIVRRKFVAEWNRLTLEHSISDHCTWALFGSLRLLCCCLFIFAFSLIKMPLIAQSFNNFSYKWIEQGPSGRTREKESVIAVCLEYERVRAFRGAKRKVKSFFSFHTGQFWTLLLLGKPAPLVRRERMNTAERANTARSISRQ